MSLFFQKIRQFLASERLWEDGLSLYLKYGKNEALKAIFRASGETSYNYQKLIAELERLAGAPVVNIPGVDTPEAQVLLNCSPKPSPYSQDQYPLGVKNLFAQRSMLHAQLLHLPTDEQRKEHAFQILNISEQVDTLLTGDRAADRPATRNAAACALPTDRAALVKLLNTNRAYISKYKSRPEKADQVNIRLEQNQKIDELLRMDN